MLGALQVQHFSPLSGTGTARLAELSDLPVLSEIAREAQGVSAEQEFRAGLEIVLRGPGLDRP
ncbi:hypothetical protein GCM10023215_42330 [Pseudonocardia yuanmonensis]|uniref:Uncharacterized protein n=1 Tax=Pseudonocardia yuanmonensis TaxID=1095914 RepID=A0ABP8X266_9PSEU